MTIDKKVDCIKLAKAVVRQTRNDVLISKTQMTDIAARCNRNRTTVSRALDAEDMTLSMWFASVSESGIDPLQLINEKIVRQWSVWLTFMQIIFPLPFSDSGKSGRMD